VLQYQKPFSGAWYVKQRLQPTRAIGDAYLKHSEFNAPPGGPRSRGRHIPPPYTAPYITSKPETRIYRVDPEDTAVASSFLILGCDGLWDVMSNEEAVR
jgi:pyruvate dehydrogenase phosphatase